MLTHLALILHWQRAVESWYANIFCKYLQNREPGRIQLTLLLSLFLCRLDLSFRHAQWVPSS